MKYPADLKHRDWLLFTQQALISKVNPNISTEIVDRDNGSKVLIITDIPEGSIKDLLFITNTDNNNNYGYLEEFNVFKFGSSIPLNIPGLSEIVQNIYRYSDMNAFLSKSTTHDPFNPKNFVNSSFKGQSFTEFVDELTALLPFTTDTGSIITTYQIIFNPDEEYFVWYEATGTTAMPRGFTAMPRGFTAMPSGFTAMPSPGLYSY
jgi:hypothetical protein